MVKKYKKYNRWCGRCGETYETKSKFSKYCTDCHLPSGGAVVVSKDRYTNRIDPIELKKALIEKGWISYN